MPCSWSAPGSASTSADVAAARPARRQVVQVDLDGPRSAGSCRCRHRRRRDAHAAGAHGGVGPADGSAERAEWLAPPPVCHPAAPFADEPEHVMGSSPEHGVRAACRLDPAPRLSSTAARSPRGSRSDGRGEAARHRPRLHGPLGTTPGLAIGAQIAERTARRCSSATAARASTFRSSTRWSARLPIVTIVVNNESWAMSLHGQQLMYGPETDQRSSTPTSTGSLGLRRLRGAGRHARRGRPASAALDHGGPACVNLAVSGEVAHPVTASMLGSPGQGGTVLPYYENLKDSSDRASAQRIAMASWRRTGPAARKGPGGSAPPPAQPVAHGLGCTNRPAAVRVRLPPRPARC